MTMILRRLALSLLLLPAAAGAAHAQSSSVVMSLDDVVTLLGAPQVSREVLGSMVRTGCVSFPVDDAAVSRLRGAGADDAFVALVRGACFTGSELVVQSRPAGAEVRLGGVRVGTTPWTTRFGGASKMEVTVVKGGTTLRAPVEIQARQRARATFTFAEDTMAIPRARSVSEVARALQLERVWKSPVPAPEEPGALRLFTGNALTMLFAAGTAAAGAAYCDGAENHCFVEPSLEDDGTDSMEPARWLAGGVAGLFVGTSVTGLLQRAINGGRRNRHAEAVAARQAWEQSDQAARAEWIRAHPDVQRILSEEREARDQAVQYNRQVRSRNQAARPVNVVHEPLPGPADS
jgi:hypothetical protein